MKSRFFALAALALAAAPALSQASITVSLIPVASPTNVPAGFTPYNLTVTTSSDWTNQSIDLTLTQGSLYQDSFGSETTPNTAFFGLVPTLQWDTFLTSPANYPNTGGTSAPGFAGTHGMDTTHIHADQWFDTDVTGAGTFIVARITLSNNAIGSFSGQAFNAESQGVGTPYSGQIGGAPVPEPASIALLSFGTVALLARKRRLA